MSKSAPLDAAASCLWGALAVLSFFLMLPAAAAIYAISPFVGQHAAFLDVKRR
jgi:hypothetical protein